MGPRLGRVRPSLAAPGGTITVPWPRVAAPGHARPRVVAPWPREAACGRAWPREAACGRVRLGHALPRFIRLYNCIRLGECTALWGRV